MAKRRGKIISPHHGSVQIFWNAIKPSPGATAMVPTLPTVPEETSMQDSQLEEPRRRAVRQGNLVWDPRVSVVKKSDEQQRTTQQGKEGSSLESEVSISAADIAPISEELHQQLPPSASQYTQPKNPLKSVVHEAKKRELGATKSAALRKVQGKSVLERLGKKSGGRGAGKTVRKVSECKVVT